MVQDAKVLPVGHKGRGSPLFDGVQGRAEVSLIVRLRQRLRRDETRHAEAVGEGGRSAGKGSMPVNESGRLISTP